jgi:RNA polymerase sigma-70 factor, ECF subfamily
VPRGDEAISTTMTSGTSIKSVPRVGAGGGTAAGVSEFIRLYTSHELRLRAFAFSLVPHWADAEEVLQAASVVLWQKFDRFEPGTNFFAWACRVVQLTAKDFRKRQRRERAHFGDTFFELVAEETERSEERLAERERQLACCMSKLKPRHRQMLHLRYQQGQTVEEVATTFGLSAKGIYQALSRVHKALFDCVERALKREGLA